MAKNYYAILGILPTATREEIRSAYRRRAKEHHPDRSGRDSSEFLDLREAYEVLSDPADRRSYDRTLKHGAPGRRTADSRGPGFVFSGRPPVEPLRDYRRQAGRGRVPPTRAAEPLRPSVEQMPDELWGMLDGGMRPMPVPPGAPVMEVLLSPEQARHGAVIRLLVPVEETCAACLGFGVRGPYDCALCGGAGATRARFPLELELPPGIPDSCEVAVPLDGLGLRGHRLILICRIGGSTMRASGRFAPPR